MHLFINLFWVTNLTRLPGIFNGCAIFYKLIAILSRQYHIILRLVGRKYVPYWRSRVYSGGRTVLNIKWAHFFFNPPTKKQSQETYGFKSRKTPPQIPVHSEFESKMTNLIQDIEFKTQYQQPQFQRKLSEHTRNIKKSTDVFVPADKTTN